MARKRLYPPSVDPGLPKLPPLPTGWRETKFFEVVDVVSRPRKLDPDGRYKLVVAKRNRGGIELRREAQGREVRTKTQFEARAGDFLISRRQIIHGACGIVPSELDGAIVSNEYSTLRTKPGLMMVYLRYLSHSSYFQRTCFHSSHGVDVEKMVFKIEKWLERPVQVPPLPEQRKIAAILSSVDEAIEATQAVIDQVQVVKKGLMQELLTKGLPGRHKKFKQTEIGQIPEDWEVVAALDVLQEKPKNGKSPRARTTPPGTPTFSIAAVRDGSVDVFGNLKYIEDGSADLSNYEISAGDLLIVRGNGNPDLVGRCGLVDDHPAGCIYPDILMRAKPNERIDRLFLLTAWNSDLVHDQILEKAKTTNGTYKINQQDVSSVLLPLPSVAEQQSIAAAKIAIDTYSERLHQERVGQERLKQALMSVLLTGELRVQPEATE